MGKKSNIRSSSSASALSSMSELQPIIPREENQHGNATVPPQQDTPEPVPITEQEVGEYREQDRFLPVSVLTFPLPPYERIQRIFFFFILYYRLPMYPEL